MVKSLYSIIIAILIFAAVGVGEQIYLKKTFDKLENTYVLVYDKLSAGEGTVGDVESVKNLWCEKKKVLHLFIPHNDIKEMDLWLSESVSYFKLGNTEEAISKLEVAISLAKQLPLNYLIKIENVF